MRFISAAFLAVISCSAFAAPLALNPDNPHYFLYNGKPTVIITSGEHYGAVLNLDFDFNKYLKTLRADGLNGTRTWAGAYCEPPSAFGISQNTLAPLAGRFIAPWARSSQPGYANGGNKFDLDQWDSAYFKRLKEFMSAARKNGVIVELNLFCPFYEESMWRLSPMNAINNVNGVGDVARTNVYTLNNHGGLLKVQEAVVRKLAGELKDFDNLYYEICNEPYFGGVTLEWQHRIADVLLDAEKKLGTRHLISRNVANDRAKVENPHPGISIFNFHYANPPETVPMNYALNKVIGDNETGFRGTNNFPYRVEAWNFLVAGGGLFNNLDYSFVAGHEDGTFVYPAGQPGGGNPVLRKQYEFLAKTFRSLDFIYMRPAQNLVAVEPKSGVSVRALANPGKECLVYLHTELPTDKNKNPKRAFAADELSLRAELPAGKLKLEWLEPKTRTVLKKVSLSHPGGSSTIPVPAFEEDIALVIRQRS